MGISSRAPQRRNSAFSEGSGGGRTEPVVSAPQHEDEDEDYEDHEEDHEEPKEEPKQKQEEAPVAQPPSLPAIAVKGSAKPPKTSTKNTKPSLTPSPVSSASFVEETPSTINNPFSNAQCKFCGEFGGVDDSTRDAFYQKHAVMSNGWCKSAIDKHNAINPIKANVTGV